MTDLLDQQGNLPRGVFITNEDLYRQQVMDKKELSERIRALEIKVMGILVPGSLVGIYVIKELFFSGR